MPHCIIFGKKIVKNFEALEVPLLDLCVITYRIVSVTKLSERAILIKLLR